MTQRNEYRSLYLSYLKYCNEHDFDRMASFYTPTIKVNDAPMDPVREAEWKASYREHRVNQLNSWAGVDIGVVASY